MNWKASGYSGAVAAGGIEAVAAGISLLEKGGNAADAAVGTLLALSVTDYGMYAIGGEIPFMIYDAKVRKVRVLSGLGSAPLDSHAIEWYRNNGIPSNGGIKAAPVPGAPSLCFVALQKFGTVSFAQAAIPTLNLLDKGKEPWHPYLAKTFRRLIETEKITAGPREEKLQAARDRFYKGDIADELVAFYTDKGSFLRKQDMVSHVIYEEDSVTTDYRGYTVCKCGSWTQRPYLLQTLQLLEGFDLNSLGHASAEYIHLLSEALKLGLADRDEYYGDPRFENVPLEALLSDQYTEIRRALIDMKSASVEIRPGDPIAMSAVKGTGTYRPGPGGTTTCVVADRWGNLVAATPSGNGPNAICEKLGVAHGNRLRSLNTTPGHPNCIKSGKRPRITLTPTLVLKEGKPVMAISVAGGDIQDQTTLNCLLNTIEFDMLPENAVRAPRFCTGHHQDSFNADPQRENTLVKLTSLTLGEEIPQSVKDDLRSHGYRIETSKVPIATPVMLMRDPDSGLVYAAGDPKAGRHAAAVIGD